MKILSQKKFGEFGWKFVVMVKDLSIRFETDKTGSNLRGITGSVENRDEQELIRFKGVHLPKERQRARRKLRYLLTNK